MSHMIVRGGATMDGVHRVGHDRFFIVVGFYNVFEDFLEKTLGLPVIYPRHMSVSLYAVIVFVLFGLPENGRRSVDSDI